MSDPTAGKPSGTFTRLLAVMVLGLVAVTVLGRFGRYWWVADLANHLTVYLAGLAAVLACIGVVFRRWRIAGSAATVLVFYSIMLYPQLPSSHAQPPPIEPQHQWRLAHLNVLRPNRDIDRVAAFLNSCDADAVFIQEASPWWVDALRDADIPYHETASQTAHDRFGIMMLMRDDEARVPGRDVRLVSSRVFDLVSRDVDRPAIEAVFTVNSQPVSVLSVHPAHPVSAAMTHTRDQMLRAARDWAHRQQLPHVVIGDFNTTPWSYAFSILTEDGHMVSTLNGRGIQGTVHVGKHLPLLLPIDHCLYSSDMSCLDHTVGPYVGSDHLPLSVTLAVGPDATQPAFDNPPPQDQFSAAHPE